jgi:hypothetical protein
MNSGINYKAPFKLPYSNSPNAIADLKGSILNTFKSNNLNFRYATIDDVEQVFDFQKRIFHPHTETLESKYELYRIIKFGFILLIENFSGEILGAYSTIHYNGEKKIAYGIRVGVAIELAGNNYAALLAKYATILGFENGCEEFHALMSPGNFKSASNVLNHVGYYCSKFHVDLPAFGSRFEIVLPLTAENLTNSAICIDKVTSYIKEQQKGKDYLLIQSEDLNLMDSVYRETDFKIIGFIRQGIIDENNYFFAARLYN